MKNFAKTLIFDGFWLKLIAILTMTIDHLAVALQANNVCDPTFYLIARNIGRIALPLFCFMTVEAVIHTRNFKRYILSLGIIGSLVLIAQIVMEYALHFTGLNQGNIFFDLILGALLVKCLTDKRIWIKFLAILPLAFGVASFIFYCLSFNGDAIAKYFPYYLRTQYHMYSLMLILFFYLSYILSKFILNNTSHLTNMNYDMLKNGPEHRFLVNILSALFLTIVTLSFYALAYYLPNQYIFWDPGMQNYAIISGAFVLLYNGKRGYNSKWFQYGCYLYYPLHLLALYGIALLLTI